MNKIIKITLSIIVTICALYPIIYSTESPKIIESIISIGIGTSIIVFLVFFTAIGFYCKSLQKILELIAPENRKINPKSVWYMFLMPYNFIEDFFIIINISNSIEQEAKNNKKIEMQKDFGMTTGISWCIAQILSFIPNYTGQIASIVGLVLWIIHWRFINKTTRLLKIN